MDIQVVLSYRMTKLAGGSESTKFFVEINHYPNDGRQGVAYTVSSGHDYSLQYSKATELVKALNAIIGDARVDALRNTGLVYVTTQPAVTLTDAWADKLKRDKEEEEKKKAELAKLKAAEEAKKKREAEIIELENKAVNEATQYNAKNYGVSLTLEQQQQVRRKVRSAEKAKDAAVSLKNYVVSDLKLGKFFYSPFSDMSLGIGPSTNTKTKGC